MSLKKIQGLTIFLLGFVIGGLVSVYYPKLSLVSYRQSQPPQLNPASSRQVNPKTDMSLFWQVWDEIEANFLFKDKIDPDKMRDGAIIGMVAALGDPYTSYLPKKENQESKIELKGQFEGVGMQLGYIDGKLAVIAPIEDTPAYRAGVKAGDIIAAIDGQDSLKIPLPEAVDKIRGPKGTKVVLTLIREGREKPFEVEIIRDTITVPSVTLKFIKTQGKTIAHLKLMRFGDLTNSQWQSAVDKIIIKQNQDPANFAGIILDLRNNPGGYLNGAVYIASEFLDRGVVVVEEGTGGVKKSDQVNRQGRLINQPLVVLVNKGSASASEIVAGALRDHRRAVLVGETTFGKGTIQQARDLGNGAGLHITVAKWLTPNGTWVHETGLEPQVVVEADKDLDMEALDELFLTKAQQVLLDYTLYYERFYQSNP